MGGTVELILEFLFQSDLNSLYIHKYRHTSFLAINHAVIILQRAWSFLKVYGCQVVLKKAKNAFSSEMTFYMSA